MESCWLRWRRIEVVRVLSMTSVVMCGWVGPVVGCSGSMGGGERWIAMSKVGKIYSLQKRSGERTKQY